MKARSETGFQAWEVVAIDLLAPIPALAARAGVGGLHVVFWLGDVPLGDLRVGAAQLPLPAGAVRALAARAVAPAVGSRILARGFAARPGGGGPVTEGCPDLREIATPGAILTRAQDALAAPHARSTERLSVVICSAGRPTALGRCLASLARSSEPPDEIVVVDNAPETGATREVVARWSGVRYVAEARRGLSIARNTGLRSSAGELVAFTDDDAEVHPAWAARVRRGFADPELLALTGLVLPAVLATEAQLVFEHDFGGFGQGYRVLDFDATFFRTLRWKGTPVWLMGAGANMAFRRRAFEQVGEFDERLGAGAAGCSEDSELWYRLLTAGHSARYDPTLVVFHHHRDDWDALRAQMHAYMRGHVAALLIQHQRHGHSGNLLRLAAILPRFYASLLLSRLLHGSSPRLRLVPAEIAGCLAGLLYFLRRRSNGARTAAAT